MARSRPYYDILQSNFRWASTNTVNIDGVIVAGAVAAIISLVGMLVNLNIAKRTRIATEAQARFAIALEDAKKSIADLRGYTADVEKLRVEAMWLNMSLPDGMLVSTERQARAESFQGEFRRFFDSWANVKTTVPDAQLEYLRLLRHGAKNIAHEIFDEIKRLKSNGKFDSSDSATFRCLQGHILRLNESLDHLYSHINNIRNERLSELVSPKSS